MDNELITTLIFATKTEAGPFIKGLDLQKVKSSPFTVFQNKSFFAIISGIGKIKSALAVSMAALILKTDLIINLGACGALDNKFEKGEILNINKIINNATGQIIYPPTLKKHKKSALLTVENPVVSENNREKLAVHAPLADMEGAGFAEACNIYRLSGYLFKIISDNKTDNSRKAIIQNIQIASNFLYNYFQEKKILTECNFRINKK